MSWFQAARPVLPDLIHENAASRGRQPAVRCGATTLSWTDFDARLNQVSNALCELGLAPGDRVAILMQNSVAMLEAMLGSIGAGLTAVPLNVAVSDEGIEKQIGDAAAAAIIASPEHVERLERLLERLPEGIAEHRLLALEDRDGWQRFEALRDAASTAPPGIDIQGTDECNIIYSSGTTGLPKGIVHSHDCRMAWAWDMAIALRYHSDARTLLSLGLYSNITWVAMLATTLCGGTLILMPAYDVTGCLELIETERVTHSAMVPVQFQRMLNDPAFGQFDLSSIEALMCCGSPLNPELKREIDARIPGDFIELYGLTEGLVTIQSPRDATANPTSVGRPCPGQKLLILDNDDRPVAAGEAGEIVGYGRLLMDGYLNRDEANEETTWVDEHGRRWLRTGDIGRLDEDGNLYVVDRKKDMIISGGQNLYPADIESVIADYKGIEEVAVIGIPSPRWGESPLAVVTGSGVDTDALVEWTNERVGRQQRIAAAVLIDELPRNPNGKVLKRELRKRYADWLDA